MWCSLDLQIVCDMVRDVRRRDGGRRGKEHGHPARPGDGKTRQELQASREHSPQTGTCPRGSDGPPISPPTTMLTPTMCCSSSGLSSSEIRWSL